MCLCVRMLLPLSAEPALLVPCSINRNVVVEGTRRNRRDQTGTKFLVLVRVDDLSLLVLISRGNC